jgi:hypothetical protein
MPANNDSSFNYTSLTNIKQNGEILLAMTNVTNENGEIAELAVATPAESNMYEVYVGSFNHFKIAHAKKALICNFTKGADETGDIISYDVIVRYNNTNSETLPTVLCSIDVSDFVRVKPADREALDEGVLSNSIKLEVAWSKLAALKDLSAYLTMHSEFHDAVNTAITAVKPFSA